MPDSLKIPKKSQVLALLELGWRYRWADAALAARGVRAIRLIQGVLALTRRHPRERILAAVTEAYAHQHFRSHTIRRLVEHTPAPPRPTLVTDDPAIRPMTQYTLEDSLR
jgi:hypothetical protein